MATGKDYKVRTLQDALWAKALRGGGSQHAPVASVTETTENNDAPAPDLVAAVFLHTAAIHADTSSSETSETSIASVSHAPPLKGKHLVWTCRINNPVDCVSVKTLALIDSGAHMVLIRPDLVKRLNLKSSPLDHPE